MIFLIQIKPVKPRTSAAPHRERDKRERDSCREKEARGGVGGGGTPLYHFPPTKLQMSVVESETRRAAFKQDPRVWSFFKAVRKSSVRQNLGGRLEYLHLFRGVSLKGPK